MSAQDIYVNVNNRNLVSFLEKSFRHQSVIFSESMKDEIYKRFYEIELEEKKVGFVCCTGCGLMINHNSPQGVMSLLQHSCDQFPLSIEDTGNVKFQLKNGHLLDDDGIPYGKSKRLEHEPKSMTSNEIYVASELSDPLLEYKRAENISTTDVLNDFLIVYYNNIHQNFVKCLFCNKIFKYSLANVNTTLKRHIIKCKEKTIENCDSQEIKYIDSMQVIDVLDQKEIKLAKERTNIAFDQILLILNGVLNHEMFRNLSFLDFLQQLVNFGAEFGKQNISNVLEKGISDKQNIYQRFMSIKTYQLDTIKTGEFSISYREWKFKKTSFIVVIAFFLTDNFEFKKQILGVKELKNDKKVTDIVYDIMKEFNFIPGSVIKCVNGETNECIASFQCIIKEISDVILRVMDVCLEKDKFFLLVQDTFNFTKNTSTNCDVLEVLTGLFKKLKSDKNINNFKLGQKFLKIFSVFFEAIFDLLKGSESLEICAHKVIVWKNKFIKSIITVSDCFVNVSVALKAVSSMNIPDIYLIATFFDPNQKEMTFLQASERYIFIENLKLFLFDQLSASGKEINLFLKNNSIEIPQFLNIIDYEDVSHCISIRNQVSFEIDSYVSRHIETTVKISDFWTEEESFPILKLFARNILNLPPCSFQGNCCFLKPRQIIDKQYANLPSSQIEIFSFINGNEKNM